MVRWLVKKDSGKIAFGKVPCGKMACGKIAFACDADAHSGFHLVFATMAIRESAQSRAHACPPQSM